MVWCGNSGLADGAVWTANKVKSELDTQPNTPHAAPQLHWEDLNREKKTLRGCQSVQLRYPQVDYQAPASGQSTVDHYVDASAVTGNQMRKQHNTGQFQNAAKQKKSDF